MKKLKTRGGRGRQEFGGKGNKGEESLEQARFIVLLFSCYVDFTLYLVW